jgi:putative ABC transport system permease protein
MRFYRLLLRLYPKSFRDEYADEMSGIFRMRLRDAEGLARLALFPATLAEVLLNAAAVHADILRQDLRYAARSLRRAPGFALTAVAVTAIGVGANMAAFSVADFVLIRPLPFPDPTRLVRIWETMPDTPRQDVSPANFRDWKSMSTSFQSMGAFHNTAVNLVGRGNPERLESAAVTADLLPTLGVAPLFGRLFTKADDQEGAPGTILLSYACWMTQFGGERDVLGRVVSLDGARAAVIGVMPESFHFPTRAVRVWTPLKLSSQNYVDRTDTFIYPVGRLRRGVSVEKAGRELAVIARRLERQYPEENEKIGAAVYPMRDEFPAQARMLLAALCGAALCVLLIACANLGNLLLARSLERRRELSVRAALGAGRERLVRQLLTESLALAVLGGGLGVALALFGVRMLTRLVPDALPIAQAPSIDLRILAFAVALTALTGIAFGVLPALKASGRADMEGLRESAGAGGGQKLPLRSALVIAEVMASMVLLVSAGLLIRALLRIQSTDPGFRPERVLTMRTALPWPKYEKTARREQFYSAVLTNVRALPGVSSAAYISFLPMAVGGGIWPVSVDGRPPRPSDRHVASMRFATPGYFATLGIPLVRGRELGDSDRAGRPLAAVVSQSFVQKYLPAGVDPIGRHVQIAGGDRTIVGVVADVRMRGPERRSEPQVYLPHGQDPDASYVWYTPKDLVVRASAPLSSLVPAIRRIIRETDPEQPVSDVRTMEEVVAEQTASRRVQVRVLGAFAAIAFLLAGVGIHGVLSYAVSSRGKEIAVRMALGAESRDIVRMVMRHGGRLALAGVIPGLVLAYAAGRAMEALLAGLKPADLTTFGLAAALCVVMTLLGSLIPALRAVRVVPMTAIRSE